MSSREHWIDPAGSLATFCGLCLTCDDDLEPASTEDLEAPITCQLCKRARVKHEAAPLRPDGSRGDGWEVRLQWVPTRDDAGTFGRFPSFLNRDRSRDPRDGRP